MLREAGAAEVHVRISSPPVAWPCYYGIDFATRVELIASDLSPEQICTSIEADSLGYISLDGAIEATGRPASSLCMACFSGQYPIPVGAEQTEAGKYVLEQVDQQIAAAHEGIDRFSSSVGGAAALGRP
jgi:amidophosphoribosyltransferase